MKVGRFIISAAITLMLVITLNNSLVVKGNRLPPLGKFLDPFHGFWHNIEPINASGPEILKLDGLKEGVTVVYDSMAVAHIFAKNDEDLYLAQGYITAAHRLWQMEFQTHAAAGRVSEITGPGKDGVILNYDRNQRRLGLAFGAEHALAFLSQDSIAKMMTEQYAKGINDYIESLSYEDLPLEYKLLDYTPEGWTPLKSALLLKSMAQTLDISDKDMEMTNALKLFGKEMVDVLYPDHELVGEPIVDRTNNWNFNPLKIDSVPSALPEDLIRMGERPKADPALGSNNWAVAGTKTATGAPMLCGDPHLHLTLPSIWYAIQLNAPGINTMGASLPGAPAVIIGFNDSIAWSVTNAQRDLVDWFAIKYDNAKRDHYLLDGKWLNTEKKIESFKVRGTDVFYDTVVYTQWGPVTYDRNYHPEANRKDYAFRWIAHDPSNEFIAFYKLNRATNHRGYMDALNHYYAPAQNFVFASVSGDIAMRVQGKYPVRRKDEGKFVLDGSHSSNGWQAFIPNEQNVMDKNPARGYVSSANQYPADATYPYYITATHFEAYRNRRINQVLHDTNNITPKDLMRLQNDNFNMKASESLPMFLTALDTTAFSPAEQHGYEMLKGWDYFNTLESEGASYYESLFDNFMALTWDEIHRDNVSLYEPTAFNTIHLAKTKPDLLFFDIKNTAKKETATDVIRAAFKVGVKTIEEWKKTRQTTNVPWADYKDSFVGHLLRIEPLSIHIRHGGNEGIVNANSKINGPSWRMVVSLEKTGVKAWATYPGGQSGNAGSEHYADLLSRWVKGQYFNLVFMHTPNDNTGRILYSTQLK